jgi:three-Cys-motif partner protein
MATAFHGFDGQDGMRSMKKQPTDDGHRFGGDWTSTKLEILKKYLAAYSIALKKQTFKIAYIDAFAGTGYRGLRQGEAEPGLLFADLAEEAPQRLLEGSTRLALQIQPRFDRYIFIEKDPSHYRELLTLRSEFPHLASDIRIRRGEANQVLQGLCKTENWKAQRAVLFLDPYGMQVDWKTIEEVSRTGAIDLWLLFPLGIGVNRLLPRSGRIPDGWRNRLNSFLGTNDWFQAFYQVEAVKSLFEEEETLLVVKRGIDVIGQYFVDRLKTVFPGVAPKPRILSNSANCPLYLFCFAVSSPNERARAIALRIANHLLESV